MSDLCPQKDICGSCGWSHIPYQKQLEQKLGDINGSFKIHELTEKVEKIVAAPITEHYRNRMDFVIDFKGQVGLREKGKWWRVIDNHTCFLADEKIEAIFHITREWTKTAGLSFFDRKAITGFLRYAVIRSTAKGETMLNIVTSAPVDAAEESHAKAELEKLAATSGATTVLWSVNDTPSDVSHGGDVRVISGPGYIEEEIDGIRYRITPNAFFQTNLYAAPVLQKTVIDMARATGAKNAVDLYCGSGFFSLALAKLGMQVHAAEMVEDAIRDARTNAELNNLQVDFTAAKIEDLDWTKHNAELVIVDPARVGLHDKVIADLLSTKPKDVIYISCNYKSFAREFKMLREAYELVDAVAIDMFPHTPHVELVVHLKRK